MGFPFGGLGFTVWRFTVERLEVLGLEAVFKSSIGLLHDYYRSIKKNWLSDNFCGHRGSQSLAQRFSEEDKILQFDNQRIMLCEPLDYLCETLCPNFTPQKLSENQKTETRMTQIATHCC